MHGLLKISHLLVTVLLIFSSCNKTNDYDNRPLGILYDRKAKIWLLNVPDIPKIPGQEVLFYPCAYLDFQVPVSGGFHLDGDNDWQKHYINLNYVNIRTKTSIANYMGNFFETEMPTFQTDSDYLTISINDNKDIGKLILTNDQLVCSLNSSNGVEISGSGILNRIKRYMVWGYIECKDSSYMKYGKQFLDSIHKANLVTEMPLIPGDYNVFKVNSDTVVSDVLEMHSLNSGSIVMPFCFQYIQSFTEVRQVAEKFVYDLKGTEGMKIWIRDYRNNSLLIKYYL